VIAGVGVAAPIGVAVAYLARTRSVPSSGDGSAAVAWQRRATTVLAIVALGAGAFQTGRSLDHVVPMDTPGHWWMIELAAYWSLIAEFSVFALLRATGSRLWPWYGLAATQCAVLVQNVLGVQSGIDVLAFHRLAATRLLSGGNPYAMTFPNHYGVLATQTFYAPGIVVDGQVTVGYPYPPPSLIMSVIGTWLGDVRLPSVMCLAVASVLLLHCASDRLGRVAALMPLLSPDTMMLTGLGWTEPLVMMLLVATVVAARRGSRFMPVILGLLLVSKQYLVFVLPLIGLLVARGDRRRLTYTLLGAVATGSAVILPWFLINPTAVWRSLVWFQFRQPFRSDSISAMIWFKDQFGWSDSIVLATISLVLAAGTSLTLGYRMLRRAAAPVAFALGTGAVLLVMFMSAKQAFINYYMLATTAWFAVVALTSVADERGHQPGGDARPAGEPLFGVGDGHRLQAGVDSEPA
jgi:hypothetical protein